VAGEPELRDAMRRFAAGVGVLTIATERERVGLTVSAVTSLSLEPPLVSVAIARQAAMHELLPEAGAFALSLLAGDQEGLAQHFARGVPPIAMWEGIELHRSEGAPLLADARAWIDCALVNEHPAGDHTLYVGGVTGIELGSDAGGSLAYVEQEYVAV
jgi:flavin reductase (DIM6/NTAB) family NADH-FMN oxidoreductase RutF